MADADDHDLKGQPYSVRHSGNARNYRKNYNSQDGHGHQTRNHNGRRSRWDEDDFQDGGHSNQYGFQHGAQQGNRRSIQYGNQHGGKLATKYHQYGRQDGRQQHYKLQTTEIAGHKTDDKNVYYFKGKNEVLSNFYPLRLKLFDRVFKSTEAAYQYCKAVFVGSPDELVEKIVSAPNGLAAKRLAHQVPASPDWDKLREEAMRVIIDAKVTQCEDYWEFLTGHPETTFVENTDNQFWAKGKHGEGQNTLGKIHMAVRDEWLNVFGSEITDDSNRVLDYRLTKFKEKLFNNVAKDKDSKETKDTKYAKDTRESKDLEDRDGEEQSCDKDQGKKRKWTGRDEKKKKKKKKRKKEK